MDVMNPPQVQLECVFPCNVFCAPPGQKKLHSTLTPRPALLGILIFFYLSDNNMYVYVFYSKYKLVKKMICEKNL